MKFLLQFNSADQLMDALDRLPTDNSHLGTLRSDIRAALIEYAAEGIAREKSRMSIERTNYQLLTDDEKDDVFGAWQRSVERDLTEAKTEEGYRDED